MTPHALMPICACATAPFPGAVAIVRVSGTGLGSLLSPLLTVPPPRQAALRSLCWEGFREDALVLFFPSPNSYTGEDVVEFHLHGNPLLVDRFIGYLKGLGIRLAEPGEFTRRALLHGKQDLLQAEALRDVIQAATDSQLRMAQSRTGGVPAWLLKAKALLSPWIARVEACVDYGEEEGLGFSLKALWEDLASLRQQLHLEQARSQAAQWLNQGIRVAIVGRPNAGKSTLFNALAGEDRAIVTPIAGTTRDVLEVQCEWAGLPLRLFDTAGLRETKDPVERLGVARVAGLLEKVDVILHLIPQGDARPSGEAQAVLAPYHWKTLDVTTFGDEGKNGKSGVVICALQGDLASLEKALKARFMGNLGANACMGALATQRQREILDEMVLQLEMLYALPVDCLPELPASLLQGLWSLIMRLTGEDRAETTLDQLFQGFCLGK